MPPASPGGAVVVEDTLDPLAADLAVGTVGQDRRVLQRDVDLVVETVRHPALDLFATGTALVHRDMERMVDMVVASLSRSARSNSARSMAARLMLAPYSWMCMPSQATSMPLASSSARSAEAVSRDGIGVVDVDEHLARGRHLRQHLEHAARPALRQVPHLPAELVADLADQHLVIAPERTVHQQAVGAAHPFEQRLVHLAEARRIEQGTGAIEVPRRTGRCCRPDGGRRDAGNTAARCCAGGSR